MLRVIKFLVVAAAAIAFFWWLMSLPGTFSMQIGGTSLAAPTPVAILAGIVLFIVLYVLVRILFTIIRLPGRTRRMKLARARDQGDAAVTRTLLALAGNDGDAARREASRSRKLLGDTPQTLLLAAYAGRQAGQNEEADAAFKLLADRKDAAFLGLRGLMQQAVTRGDWTEAQALSDRAEQAAPGSPWLRTERLRLAVRSKSWKQALTLSGAGDPVAAIGAAAAESESDPSEARRLAKRAWKADSGFVPAALVYARLLREAGKERAAQEVIRTTWRTSPHPDLAILALASDQGGVSRQSRADTLAAANPTHGESQLMLAEVALETNNLIEARRHAEAAAEFPMTRRRAWRVIADIAERDNDPAYRAEAMRRAAEAAPDPVWRCTVCGTEYHEWHAVCQACNSAGSIVWTGAQDAPIQERPHLLAADEADSILP